MLTNYASLSFNIEQQVGFDGHKMWILEIKKGTIWNHLYLWNVVSTLKGEWVVFYDEKKHGKIIAVDILLNMIKVTFYNSFYPLSAFKFFLKGTNALVDKNLCQCLKLDAVWD